VVTDLFESELGVGLQDLDDGHHRDADDGGQGQQETQGLSPTRERVIPIRRWLEIHPGEHHDYLQKKDVAFELRWFTMLKLAWLLKAQNACHHGWGSLLYLQFTPDVRSNGF
jgi:hypothetical protein